MTDCGFEANDIRTMVMFGQGQYATPWVEVSSPVDVTKVVLFPAAQFGQVKTLQKFIANGDPYLLDDSNDHKGWNLYHFAVQGYKMNCNYLVSSTESNSNLPSTVEQARETQLDIIHALAEGGVMPFDTRNPDLGSRGDGPPHPSQLALDVEYNFLEAAYLIDILVIIHSDPNSTISTPGLEMIQVSNNREYKVALHHLMKWSYDRNYLDVLGYCHDRYHSICGDAVRLQPGNLPMFLHAVTTSKLNVIQFVFDHEEKKPLPDRIMSKIYEVGPKEAKTKASAVSIACQMALDGNQDVLCSIISHKVIGNHLLNISLSELQLEEVPLALFHERLNSLSLSNNSLAALPPVSDWKCQNLMFFSIEFNRFEHLPAGLFKLPKLLTLNAGNNRISQLDLSMWRGPSLKTLQLNKNRLKLLPSPKLRKVSIEEQDDDGNNRESLSVVYQIFGISHGFVNHGVQRSDDPYKSGNGYILQSLDVSDNQIVEIPDSLPCLAPQLRTLKISRNMIKDFKSVAIYPPGLKSLELIGNNATECIRGGGCVPMSHCLQSSPSNTINCLHREHTSLVELHHLNFNKNMLTEIILEELGPARQPSFSGPSLPPSRLLFPSLRSLSFAHNKLTDVPASIYKQTNLFNLDVSHNPNITQLPLKIHLLQELTGFQFKGIGDPIIKQLENCKDLGHMRHYLRARQTKTLQNSMLRLNIIGHYKKGKSTVLRNIYKHSTNQKKEFTYSDPSPQAMHSKTWQYLKRKLPSGEHLSFCTWVFGGQDEYYPVHKCFLTNRALYLLVWKVTDRDSGINGLGVWLRNLQAKAPGSQVIIVGTHIDMIPNAERVTFMKATTQMIMNAYDRPMDTDYPKIRRVHFVDNEETKMTPMSTLFSTFTASKCDELLEILYEEATKMEIPKTRDMRPNFHMKILEEQVPKTYLELEGIVIHLRDNCEVNIIPRSEFCKLSMVKNIISECSEVDTAMDTLHNRGTLFHFHMDELEDYYILNTQWWFEACGHVVSFENVDSLIATGDRCSGILGYEKIDSLFRTKGIEEYTSLVLQFLHQHEVILPIDSGSALVPSLLPFTPTFKLVIEPGMFPFDSTTTKPVNKTAVTKRHSFHKFIPAAANKSLPSNVRFMRSGLVLRRMFLLPPIGPNFWNRVINLCLQKGDFPEIVRDLFDDDVQTNSFDHGQFNQIGMTCQMRWKYWKSGIALDLNNYIILSINSLKSDEFADPAQQTVISETSQKVKRFQFFDEKDGYFPLDGAFSEVFEVIVPEIHIVSDNGNYKTISSKLLAKSLEIIDEVLRGYSVELAEDGIYTLSKMFHVIPCPLCFGDIDKRPREIPVLQRMISGNDASRPRLGTAARCPFRSMRHNRLSSSDSIDGGGPAIVVFSIDQCIEVAGSGTEYVECPNHGNIALNHLAPDLCFNDLYDLKLDISCLANPPGGDGRPVGQGCFGIVYHKLLNYDTSNNNHVAVKEFVVDDMLGQNEQTNEVKKYSDMRYEINKLSVLNHDYIVKFVGVVARPPSFVLEWAPLMSLEKIRVLHEKKRCPICPVSLYITLLQVLDGLHYLHAPPVGIIHSDLKLSNILAFEFPEVGHTCCNSFEDRGRCVKAMPEMGCCGIKVKLGDMGVCVNPTGQDTGDNLGVKRFAPECNSSSEKKKLTEKVDIFCLGICIYELLSLDGLPPLDYSELEYRRMLSRGWRPLFHSKNFNYPLPLNLLMERCWELDYTKRPSALVLKDFIEGITGLNVENKFEVEVNKESLSHCLDGFMLVSDSQEVTAFHMVIGHTPLLIYLAVSEGKDNKVISLEAMDDDETKKQFFKATIIDQCGEEKVTAIHVTNNLDAVLGYKDGRVVYIRRGGSYPQAISNNLCNEEFEHGEVNFIEYIEKEELIVTGFANGAAHMMKVQARYFGDMFLRGFYCCKKESTDLTATGSYTVIYKPDINQLEVWCGCNNNQVERWNFPLHVEQKWSQSLIDKTSGRISLRNTSCTTPSSVVCAMSVTPDYKTVFALIGDAITQSVVAICQLNADNGKPLKHWQCDMEKVSYFSATASDLVVGTTTGHSVIYSRQKLESQDVYKASCDINVLSHASRVSQIVLFDGSVSPDGHTSMFNTYLGKQSQATSCRYIISIGKGFLNPLQFNSKTPLNSASERDGYCINVWAV